MDAMGGEQAPHSVIEAALQAVSQDPSLEICLFIDPAHAHLVPAPPPQIELCLCSGQLSEEDDAFAVMKAKQKPSLIQAMASVASGDCQALISAGPTGAVLASAVHLVGCIAGVKRPAAIGLLATINPDRPYMALVDCGANADIKANYYRQLAELGSIYVQSIFGIDKPRVGLLSNGVEKRKGNTNHRQGYEAIAQSTALNFVGNVEPHGLMQGQVDVLVSDGFSGNIYLKQYEEMSAATLAYIHQHLANQFFDSDSDRLKVEGILDQARRHFDTNEGIGGFLLLGVKQAVFVVHGNAGPAGFLRAIDQVKQCAEGHLLSKLVQAVDHFSNE